MKKAFYLCILGLYSLIGLAQNPQHLNFNSANHTACIIPDGDFIWYGTESCLIKRNVLTNQCETFTENNTGVAFNFVSALALDEKSHLLWAASDSGLIRYDGNSFVRYDLLWPSFNTYSRYIRDISADTLGNVWLALGEYGLAKFDANGFSYFNYTNTGIPNDIYRKIKVTKDGKVWAGTQSKGLIYFNNNQWLTYNKNNSVLAYNYIDAMALDSLSQLYFSDSDYLYRFGSSMQQLLYLAGTNTYSGISIDKQQNVWLCDNNLRYKPNWEHYWCLELKKYNPVTGDTTISLVKTNFEKNIGLNPSSACFDEHGNCWIGMFWGLQKVNLQSGVGEFFYQGLPPAWTNITSFVENAFGKMWMGAYVHGDDWCGLGSFDGTSWETYIKYNSNLKSDGIYDMAKDKQGNLWLSVKYVYSSSSFPDTNFIYKYNGQDFTIMDTLPINHDQHSLVVDTFNNVWTADIFAIRKYNGTSQVIYDSTSFQNHSISLTGFFIKAMEIDANNVIWILANHSTLSYAKLIRLDGANWTAHNLPDSCQVYTFSIDKNNRVWLSSSHGLYLFDGISWTNYNTSNSGISSNTVSCSVSDNNGKVYIASVSTASPPGEIDVFDGTNWGKVSGLPTSNYWYDPYFFHLFCDSQNNIYFSYYGFVHVYNESRQGVRFSSLYKDRTIAGKVFYDTNQNWICDSAEVGLSNRNILLLPEHTTVRTNSKGEYKLNSDTSSHNVVLLPKTNWNSTSAPSGYNVLASSANCCYNFGTIPNTFHDNLSISVSNAAPVRCGFSIPYYLTYKNSGTTICNGSITFNFSGSFQFNSATVAPQTSLPGSLQWSFTNLFPDEERSILVQLTAPLISSVPLCTYAEIFRYSGSQLVFEDGGNFCSTLTCSFDPNEKSVVPEGITAAHYTLKTDALEYCIRFQNLGNDTAFTVIVKDSLSSFLDWNSFELIASSFPCFTTLDSNGFLIFRFENIRLPHDEANEPGSHGFVKYRIHAKTSIPEEAQVFNKASIYFDFNYPIATNTVFNTLVTSIPLSINQKASSSGFVLVQPNPIQEKAVIYFVNDAKGTYDLQVSDLFGKTVYRQKSQLQDQAKSGKFEIDASGFAAGIYFFKIAYGHTGKSLGGKFVKL